MTHTMKDQAAGSLRSRRQHEREFKNDLVAQSLVPGASVSAIAMKGGINANLLFKWRREHLRCEAQRDPAATTLLPVYVIPDADPAASSAPGNLPAGPVLHRSARPGVIEVEVAGAVLRLRGAVDEPALCSVLRALRQST